MTKNIFAGKTTEVLLLPYAWMVPLAPLALFIAFYLNFTSVTAATLGGLASFFTIAGFSLFAAITVFIPLAVTGNAIGSDDRHTSGLYTVLYQMATCILLTALFLSAVPLSGAAFEDPLVVKDIIPFVLVFSALTLFASLWLLHQVVSYRQKG